MPVYLRSAGLVENTSLLSVHHQEERHRNFTIQRCDLTKALFGRLMLTRGAISFEIVWSPHNRMNTELQFKKNSTLSTLRSFDTSFLLFTSTTDGPGLFSTPSSQKTSLLCSVKELCKISVLSAANTSDS
jgi:hypothetical protein